MTNFQQLFPDNNTYWLPAITPRIVFDDLHELQPVCIWMIAVADIYLFSSHDEIAQALHFSHHLTHDKHGVWYFRNLPPRGIRTEHVETAIQLLAQSQVYGWLKFRIAPTNIPAHGLVVVELSLRFQRCFDQAVAMKHHQWFF